MALDERRLTPNLGIARMNQTNSMTRTRERGHIHEMGAVRSAVRELQRRSVQVFALPGLVRLSLVGRPAKRYSIVEIGVFKGDTAVLLIQLIGGHGVEVHYVGFDLFENQEEFFLQHPEDRKWYDHPDYPYWEFESGDHAFSRVFAKITSILPKPRFTLVSGDSTQTVRTNQALIGHADLVYIDGCHDYEIVRKDWENVIHLFEDNPSLIVAFDDATYLGVSQLRGEIQRECTSLRVLHLNFNQFYVCSLRMPLGLRVMLETLSFLARSLRR